MPSLTACQEKQLAAARQRAALTVKALTEVAARFALAADAAPGGLMERQMLATAVLLSGAAREHATRGHCLACHPDQHCRLLGVADAFLTEDMVTV